MKAQASRSPGKAVGPSGIVAEMLKPVGEAGAVEVHVRDLIEDIISEGCIPTDCQESFIVNLYKDTWGAFNRGNYMSLMLIEQVMKVSERVVEGLIRQRVEIDEMQCGFNVWPVLRWVFIRALFFSPLLFTIVLEALSREFRTGCPWELLCADDLMISAESMEELLVKVKTWKTEMKKKAYV